MSGTEYAINDCPHPFLFLTKYSVIFLLSAKLSFNNGVPNVSMDFSSNIVLG